MDDQQFRRILDFLGLSWKGYRKVRKGVKRCISRHMLQIGFRRVDELLLAMETDGELRKQVENLMTVSISRFFRDWELWQILEKCILPEMIERKYGKVNVWSAGCACGEEVYSFRILWDTMQRHFEWMPELELWATDLNPLYLEKAREGIYPLSSLKELQPEYRVAYFTTRSEARFRVSDFLKEGVLWRVHNLLSDVPPRTGFQLIFLRNSLLTYYKDEIKEQALGRIVESLEPGGFLIIGSHEKMSPSGSLVPFPHHPDILKRAGIPVRGS